LNIFRDQREQPVWAGAILALLTIDVVVTEELTCLHLPLLDSVAVNSAAYDPLALLQATSGPAGGIARSREVRDAVCDRDSLSWAGVTGERWHCRIALRSVVKRGRRVFAELQISCDQTGLGRDHIRVRKKRNRAGGVTKDGQTPNLFDETTVRYPPSAVPKLVDDETTVPVDVREMNATAEASMFVDLGDYR
jgi:hypothetical protein